MITAHAVSKRCRAALRAVAGGLLIGLVRAYQLLLSPWLGPRCRHIPSCSRYAIESIERFGPLAGGWIALKRISRCHPWGSWGYDPVPAPEADDGMKRDGGTVRRPVREL